MKKYFSKIYKTRFFWSHLAATDMKVKFRYSKLGFLWGILQPIFLTLILALVFGVIYEEPLGTLAMYILSGTVVWNLLQNCMVGGAGCLIAGASYIRQFNHPITIYSLRAALFNMFSFLLECIALFFWILFTETPNLMWAVISLPATIMIYTVLAWLLVTIAGYLGARYRDYTQISVLVMQMVYFFSPVFFKEEIFVSNPVVYSIYRYNPVTHIVNLLREPFVYGRMPGWDEYGYVFLFMMIMAGFAFLLNRKHEKKIIFYL